MELATSTSRLNWRRPDPIRQEGAPFTRDSTTHFSTNETRARNELRASVDVLMPPKIVVMTLTDTTPVAATKTSKTAAS
ncbi:hypothetical protein [Leifsonia sp. fls2-241-R2A-40a]|uniref:hypothetical protein n=1 Tax=Leifsonia sp. fls2-241-R2A-40a TaxID=3040290 RepID=UPI00254BC555|nr:hypothetical protein [Leifsonia sp. fls2-241-R2A-40a]